MSSAPKNTVREEVPHANPAGFKPSPWYSLTLSKRIFLLLSLLVKVMISCEVPLGTVNVNSKLLPDCVGSGKVISLEFPVVIVTLKDFTDGLFRIHESFVSPDLPFIETLAVKLPPPFAKSNSGASLPAKFSVAKILVPLLNVPSSL